MTSNLALTGLDGANPLGFLAAVGTLRLASQLFPRGAWMCWEVRGRWAPLLGLPDGVTGDELVARLHDRLHRNGDPGAAKAAGLRQKEYESLKRQVKAGERQVRHLKVRGAARDAAVRELVEPLRRKAEAARAEWLRLLEAAVPVPFLALGKSLAVSEEEYRRFTERAYERLHAAGAGGDEQPAGPRELAGREDADFAVAFGCEACLLRSGRLAPTEFQLVTGSGHQFFLETFRILMEEITPEKLRRCLFGPWTWPDAKRSFRWDPAEDRRYAYGWSDPSGEEVRTEHGANLLAAMALPLFPSVPTEAGLATTAFDSRRGPPTFTWPVWQPWLGVDVVRSLLALGALRDAVPDRAYLLRLGVAEVFRTSKIEVGRPPLSKLNLTPPVAV
jgi:hypothetical protein